MDSVRSEHSELGTGRGAGASSFSVLDSSSLSSSRASTTRSDFRSNFEQKFLERKAEKKKKRERDRRLADATTNQLTADDKRRADRERERLARKAEMATWLPTPAALRQREKDRTLRTREAMDQVLQWYPRDASAVIEPLFVADSAHARDAERELHAQQLRARIESDTAALQRRVADLQQKLSCVERVQRRRKPQPHATRRLAPLNNHTQSAPTLPTTNYVFRDPPAVAAHAAARDQAELAVFLDAHKRVRRRDDAARTIQATWRMTRVRRCFRRWRAHRTELKRSWFQVWTLAHRLATHAQRAAKRRSFRAWRDYVVSAMRLRRLELQLYRDAEVQPEVPTIVRNLVLLADDDDDAYTRKVLAHPLAPSYYTGFVNAAFASVEATTTATSVRLLRAQHIEARRAVAKRIVQRLFLLWKRVHADTKRVGLDAQLCLKRAARLAFQQRPVWAGEKLLTAFELWARWAAFARSKRLHVPMPHFATPLPLWDVWLHNYHERQIRKVKAAAKAPLARMRRCFRSFRALAAFARRKRLALEAATRFWTATTTRSVLLAWRDAIADDAARKKRVRSILQAWHTYSRRKRAMRPWKREVVEMRWRREQQRAWSAWRHVQLRSVFKRELHRARLVSQPAWRWKVQRLLLVWMDVWSPVHKWQCFMAWKHCVARRKLFLTLRRHCDTLRRKHLLYGVFGAWKAVVWKQEDEFLEDRLRLGAADAYRELSPLVPMLFYGCFSDAAAIFAGVSSSSTFVDSKEDVLVKRQRDVRAFHASLLHGSVTEVRNLILNARHLVNGVDDLTGNTALHVAAAQLEDDVRRLEIISLLLSEGACSQTKPNRHGLTPLQLAPDDATRRLLDRGIYAFHADGVLKQAHRPTGGAAESRLLWCLVARMSSEYVRGDRIAGDLRREWYSELQDERWLRRGRVSFASTSEFSAPIHRCRAFLNGMKRRISRSKDEVLAELWTRAQKSSSAQPRRHSTMRPTLIKRATRSILSRDLERFEEKIDLLSWLKNTPDDPSVDKTDVDDQDDDEEEIVCRDKVLALGEYGAYGQALLWPVLHDEAAEHDLVHRFVGVLFSLAFPVDVVLLEALRLEDECNKLENEVLQGYQAIMAAELRCRSPEQPHGLPLLRYFTEQSDAELMFKRELLVLNMELLRRRQQSITRLDEEASDENDWTVPRVSKLQLEADVLLAKVQRKQRKLEKKVAAAEQVVVDLADADARVMLATPITVTSDRLREICDTRIRLEEARLRVAAVRLKQLDWAATASDILTLRQSLDTQEISDSSIATTSESDGEMLARRAFLETELKRYTHELKPNGSARANVSSLSATPSITELRRLHKTVSAALWVLFIKNLFRSCCCWLAENLLIQAEQQQEGGYDDDAAQDQGIESEGTARGEQQSHRPSTVTIAEPVTSIVATTFAAARKASAAATGGASGGARRRSSVANARATLDTMHRSADAVELVEIQTKLMRENYATSSQLLFESDRGAMLEDERRAQQQEHERLHQTRLGTQRGVVTEQNPTTGLAETPPSRLLDVDEIAALPSPEDTTTQVATQRNRKREIVRRAMAQRQLERLAARASDGIVVADEHRDLATIQKRPPLEDGMVIGDASADEGFGNFVVGSTSTTESSTASPVVRLRHVPVVDKTVAAALAESLWKRGGTVRRKYHGDPLPSAAPSALSTARGASGFELFASAEDENAFNAAFRAMSASRERRETPSSRRMSSIGAVAGNGLRTASPPADTTESLGEETAQETLDMGAFEEPAPVDEWGVEPSVDGDSCLNNDDRVSDEHQTECPEPDAAAGLSAQTDNRLLVDFAAMVSPADEAAFFDQTLQHYLERVRRDSVTGVQDNALGAVDSVAQSTENESELLTDASALETFAVADAEYRKTPHIKWEGTEEAHPPRPLHVESTRLLVPTVPASSPEMPSVLHEDTVLSEALFELERRQQDARMLQNGEPLALSGRTTTMAARRRKSSVASTLTRQRKRSSVATPKLIVKRPVDKPPPEDETPLSPSVPRIEVAIQRRGSQDVEVTPVDAYRVATPETIDSSSTRRNSQQQPLVLAQCELRLDAAEVKTNTKIGTATRRRTIHSDATANSTIVRQLSRRQVGPVDFCLEGARALAPISTTTLADVSPGAPDTTTITLPDVTAEQKRQLWREFTDAPISDAMQDSYAALYPHLYEPVTPLPAAPATSSVETRRCSDTAAPVPMSSALGIEQQIALDKRFWSAVEGFKAVGTAAGLVVLDDKTAKQRRIEAAVAIYQQFLSGQAPQRLAWLSTYDEELRNVERWLLTAPRALFDALQQTAQRHISTLTQMGT